MFSGFLDQEQIEYDFGFPLDWDKKTGVESHITIFNDNIINFIPRATNPKIDW